MGKIGKFKDYLNARDFTNFEHGEDDEDEFGNFINYDKEEEEEIKRNSKLGKNRFKWPKNYSPEDDEEGGNDYNDELERLRKTIMKYQKPEKKDRDLKERPKKRTTNERLMIKFDDFIK